MTGIITAATLTAILVAAGTLVWRWNERKNADPAEHNTITGTGADA
ncbi:membrane protein [Gordonia phage Budski]|nr:membrane protein [Gordonia phage Budski]